MPNDNREELMEQLASSLEALKQMSGVYMHVRTLCDGAKLLEIFDTQSGKTKIISLTKAVIRPKKHHQDR